MSRLLCLFLLPLALPANELRDYLQYYEGRWVGQFSIHSTANGYTESFPVEHRYWWKEEGLRKLKVEGFDTYVFGEGLAYIVFKGELSRQPEKDGGVGAGHAVE